MTAPSKAEELAQKFIAETSATGLDDGIDSPDRIALIELLREYGAAVRARDAEICRDNLPYAYQFCAAAIAREPLP